LSKKSWIIAANSPLVDRIGRYRLEACGWKGLLERIVSVSPFARCLLEVVAR
jgi:hypothetical protein